MTTSTDLKAFQVSPLSFARHLYLDLMKDSLLGFLAEDIPLATFRGLLQKEIDVNPKEFDYDLRVNGEDWPSTALSMIGRRRMDNLQECIENVIKDGIPGNFIECGVWRGGATIFMRAMLKAYNITNRTVYVADSFEGLPLSDAPEDSEMRPLTIFGAGVLSVNIGTVRANFYRYGLMDEQVVFIPGWFSSTLHRDKSRADIDSLAILRIDGDLYQSTMDALVLYPKLSLGGYCIIDDYVLPPCAKAVHDYRSQHQIMDEIITIDNTGAFWRKS